MNANALGGVKIPPEATPTDSTLSASVCTVMPVVLPAVASPIVRPVSVMVKAVLAASVAPAVVMTMEVAPGGLIGVKLAPPVDKAPVGVALVAKKPNGYESVILLPAASAPPAVVVNENVAAALVLPTTRSLPETANDVEQTELELQICPDDMPKDTIESALVDIVTPDALPAVAPPMVRPVRVTVTAVLELSAAIPVVMTIDVAVGAAALLDSPPLMATAGVALVVKKPEGYVSVILLPAASAPPAVVVNENVAVAPVLPEMRSTFET